MTYIKSWDWKSLLRLLGAGLSGRCLIKVLRIAGYHFILQRSYLISQMKLLLVILLVILTCQFLLIVKYLKNLVLLIVLVLFSIWLPHYTHFPHRFWMLSCAGLVPRRIIILKGFREDCTVSAAVFLVWSRVGLNCIRYLGIIQTNSWGGYMVTILLSGAFSYHLVYDSDFLLSFVESDHLERMKPAFFLFVFLVTTSVIKIALLFAWDLLWLTLRW